MSRPKGSKNKPKGKKITSKWMKEDHESMKAKYSPDNPIWATDLLASPNQFEWIGQIQAFCEKKGFPPSELIERYQGLEKVVIKEKSIRHKAFLEQVGEDEGFANATTLPIGAFKPFLAPQIEKQASILKKEDKSVEGPENGLNDDVWEQVKGKMRQAEMKESKPKELSNFMKARQALKNNQK